MSKLFVEIQARFGLMFPLGHIEDLRPMSFTLDEDLHVVHRPLALYIVFAVFRIVCGFALRFLGFRRRVASKTTYWHFQRAFAECEPPVLFFHGLGIGLGPYVLLLKKLALGHSVIAVEQPWISQALRFRVPTP